MQEEEEKEEDEEKKCEVGRGTDGVSLVQLQKGPRWPYRQSHASNINMEQRSQHGEVAGCDCSPPPKHTPTPEQQILVTAHTHTHTARHANPMRHAIAA